MSEPRGRKADTIALAIEAKIPVQDVPYAKLRERLLKDGQILNYTAPAGEAKKG